MASYFKLFGIIDSIIMIDKLHAQANSPYNNILWICAVCVFRIILKSALSHARETVVPVIISITSIYSSNLSSTFANILSTLSYLHNSLY